MHLAIALNPHAIRRWQIDLADRLRALGHRVSLHLSDDAARGPAGLSLLATFEETLYGRHRPLGARLAATDLSALPTDRDGDAAPDLMIDLATGDIRALGPGRRLMLRIEGTAPEAGIARALIDRRAPWVELILVEQGSDPRVIVAGIPAVPNANVLIRGFETVAARLITLVELAVADIERGADGERVGAIPSGAGALVLDAGVFAIANITEKIALKLKRMTQQADQWVVGWRELADDAVIDTLEWPAADYNWLPDDGLRYYADPFVFEEQGKRYLFVEDYVYAARRGHLSVATWTGAGWSTPRAIVERPYHLSWPRVFRRDGAIWMIPETSEARTLELYRAVDFPHKWELATVLASDISLADATMIERDDGCWMLASIIDRPGTSSWDGLAVLRADDPLKAWRLTGTGAALIDVRAARPAGEIVERAGHWLRPVQDCSLSYGSGLGIARIDMLGEGQIRQTLVAQLSPRPDWNAIGVHTLNAAAGLEVIDINRGFDIARRASKPR
jgi:hypothetical protein